MSHPLIIVSPNEQLRTQVIDQFLTDHKAKLDHPDVLFLADKLGIEQVKKVKEHLNWKPALLGKRIVIINPADNLTSDAQNSLLKILEEPFESSKIILGVENEESLLLTVRSRSEIRVIQVGNQNRKTQSDDKKQAITDLLGKNIPDRMEGIETIEDKKAFLSDLLVFYSDRLSGETTEATSVKRLLRAEKWVSQNVSAKAVLDFLMISLPKTGKM